MVEYAVILANGGLIDYGLVSQEQAWLRLSAVYNHGEGVIILMGRAEPDCQTGK